MTRQALILIGAGGHGKVVAEAAAATGRYRVAAFADDKYEQEKVEGGILRVPVADVQRLLGRLDDVQLILAVGNNVVRRRLEARLGLSADWYATVVHPSAVISKSATIGRGTVVLAGAILNADAVVGRHAIVNTKAVVEHDCAVGDYTHVSPAAALAGGVTLEAGAQVGIGACVLPGLTVGAWSTLGAGATAIRDVPAGCTAVGVPASHIRYRNAHQDHLLQVE
ncbi:acetyltransferase [Cohnella nanjingensis]|uniref:Acetyltransferase n=1 Tax=Cohnella nanjingensis TaxID=1387779 RepID=A0A7X0VIC7_9BACL|nr:acetyltransferase [Cohnella nanjingensis]MBB6674816.1 acetyltransferase [Cohnella nanjingensis]